MNHHHRYRKMGHTDGQVSSLDHLSKVQLKGGDRTAAHRSKQQALSAGLAKPQNLTDSAAPLGTCTPLKAPSFGDSKAISSPLFSQDNASKLIDDANTLLALAKLKKGVGDAAGAKEDLEACAAIYDKIR
jgi:hypothetical protein